jgi:hypothetical protein
VSQTGPVIELEKAAAEIAKTETAPAAPDAGPGLAPATRLTAQQMQQAIADYKAGKMEDTVTRLQVIARHGSPVAPATHGLAGQRCRRDDGDLHPREKGDPRAIAAVAQYEKMQTARDGPPFPVHSMRIHSKVDKLPIYLIYSVMTEITAMTIITSFQENVSLHWGGMGTQWSSNRTVAGGSKKGT